MLSRILNKKYNYQAEVIDPRGRTLRGIPSRPEAFDAFTADFYDLIVGLHPDQATHEIAEAALVRPTILIPCCNFWSDERLGRDELVNAIADYYQKNGIRYEIVNFSFQGPKNIGLVSEL